MSMDMYIDSMPKKEGYSFTDLISIGGIIDEYGQYEPVSQEELMWWREAGMIHSWFVKNVQEGEDDRGHHLVTKEMLEKLLWTVNIILDAKDGLERKKLADRYLPVGHHDRNKEYDDVYFMNIENTKYALEGILRTADFDNNYIYYNGCW